MSLTIDDLRRYAISRSLFTPTTLPRAIHRLGFVQADPIRAPARAQDLTLRHRVKDYQAGDLERRYARLGIEEDFFVNYGFVPRAMQALMHPRKPRVLWTAERQQQAQEVLGLISKLGTVHPRQVQAQFEFGKVSGGFGATINASTQLLDGMHYRGMLRVAGRVGGIRTYALPKRTNPTDQPSITPEQSIDALVDVIVKKYAPLPGRSLQELIALLRGGVPQWAQLLAKAMQRAKERLPSALVGGTTWYWPAGEKPDAMKESSNDAVYLLAPFDPVVWDRRRFELFWGWAYRFEAYTPAAKRVRGYYALPLLWQGHVIGWGNLSWQNSQLTADLGYVTGSAPRDRLFKQALEEELTRMQVFLG